MEETKFSAKRVQNILIMLVSTILLSVALGMVNQFYIDQIITDALVSFLFFLIFVLCLIHGRTHNLIAGNSADDYGRICMVYTIGCVLIFAFSFLPEFVSPILFLTMLFCVASNSIIGITIAIFFDTLLCLSVHADFYELTAYVFLSLAGCVLTDFWKEKSNRKYLFVLSLCISCAVAFLFHYLLAFNFDIKLCIYIVLCAFLFDLLIYAIFDKILKCSLEKKNQDYDRIISEDYPLVTEIKDFSKAEYLHAKKVSGLCERCANIIGCDPKLVKAAGFYYRLGKIQGEKPFVENGVLMAQNDCFPPDVTQILAEYNGELHLPSTKASALVHIIDSLVTKFEIMDKTTVSSTWNYEVVIFQTMNEKSATGIYDESGLTMNQFLKIREFFVKGENLF